MKTMLAVGTGLVLLCGGLSASSQQALDDLLERAGRYTVGYESSFWLLAMDEESLQWLERPNNPGTNLTRANPGGGMVAGGRLQRRTVKSEYLLVQLGPGRGWLPFRDPFDVDARETRSQDDRLVRLFRGASPDAFTLASEIHQGSRRHDIGNVSRTINIPTLGMMLLHPDVRERFRFAHEADESIAGREVERVSFSETARPTLVKTTRGRDLALTGRMWIESSTGVVVKTETTAADPAVRATVTVTYRRDGELGMWVPERMEEYYKASLALDDIFVVSTYSVPRVFYAQ
jgi:hypothetical protein